MKAIRTSFVVLALLITTSAAHGQRYELTGRRVALYNLAGSMRIEAGTGSAVVVEVERLGRDANRLTVRANPLDGVPTLRVIYPADEIVADEMDRNSQTNLTVDEEGTWGRSRGGRRVRISSGRRGSSDALHAQARLIVRVPQGVSVEAHLAVGDMTASNVAGDLEMETSSGSISSTGTRGNLTVETASGDIDVTHAQGELKLETASGGIEINGATGKRVDAETASGSIRLADVRAEEVKVETASGRIRVERTSAPRLEASTASGSVRVELDGEVRDVEISTASGGAEAVLPANFAGEVELETASGSIDVDFPMTIIRQRRNHVRGTIGQGGSARVSMSAASGDVRLLRR
jgi:lia operon protein LiaG